MKFWWAITAVFTLLLACVGLAMPVSAHVLRSDNGVTAELHVPPDDKPLAAQATTLQFTFENLPAAFSIVKCDCQVQVTGPASPMTITPVSYAAHRDRLTGSVTFPRAGEYVVRLTGYLTSEHADQFSIPYDIHVYPASIQSNPAKQALGWRLIGLCAVTAIIVLAYYYRPKRIT